MPRERVGEAALRLAQPDDVVVELPLRPAPHDLGGVEQLERDALGGQAVGVVGQRDGRVGRPQVQAAGDRHDPLAGLGLDLGPGLVGALGEPDVVGPVIGEPDDPAVVGRRAVDVTELELLEPEDAVAERPAEPVGRPRADRPEPDDDRVPVAARLGHQPDRTVEAASTGHGPVSPSTGYAPERSAQTRAQRCMTFREAAVGTFVYFTQIMTDLVPPIEEVVRHDVGAATPLPYAVADGPELAALAEKTQGDWRHRLGLGWTPVGTIRFDRPWPIRRTRSRSGSSNSGWRRMSARCATRSNSIAPPTRP